MKRTSLLLGPALAGAIALTACRVATLPPILPDEPGGKSRGPAYIDSAELVVLESFPMQLVLVISGTLPTPCHELAWEVSGPDEEGRISVEVHSLYDPEQVCIQVLKGFNARIPLGHFSSLPDSVWLNGEPLG